MAKIEVSCPNPDCPAHRRPYSVDEAYIGKKGRCKRCNTTFLITRTSASGPASPAPASQAPAQRDKPSGDAEDGVPEVWKEGDVILDLYEVKGVLGEGGMGRVYRVHHRGWNMDLAVKCPKPNYFQSEQHKRNFAAECQAWIQLGLHPSIVSCYYVRNLGGIPRVFAECVEGGSLKQWINSGKLYNGGPDEALKRILDVSAQLAQGLHYAHGHRLIHQDVKPANVMMTPDGIAKVTDFGLAKARAATGEVLTGARRQTMLATYGGRTPEYCSPEQAEIAAQSEAGIPPQKRIKLTRRTDIWSWAVSVFEMFCGEPPCDKDHPGHIAGYLFDAYLEQETEDPRLPKMPAPMAELLRWCFREDFNDRPKDMQEITTRLKDAYRQVIGQEYHRTTTSPALALPIHEASLEHLGPAARRHLSAADILLTELELKEWLLRTFRFVEYVIDGIQLLEIDEKPNGWVYEVYRCDSRQTALQFLSQIPQQLVPPQYYVIVTTPFGNVGKDMKGIFDESTGQAIDLA